MPERPLAPGTVVRIMTGAPVPDGSDAVVPFEDTDELERKKSGSDGSMSAISINTAAEPGDNIRDAGEDITAGTVVLDEGETLGAAHIGVIASLGRATMRAIDRKSVA